MSGNSSTNNSSSNLTKNCINDSVKAKVALDALIKNFETFKEETGISDQDLLLLKESSKALGRVLDYAEECLKEQTRAASELDHGNHPSADAASGYASDISNIVNKAINNLHDPNWIDNLARSRDKN